MRGISDKTVGMIEEIAAREEISLIAAAGKLIARPAARQSIELFRRTMARLADGVTTSPSELMKKVLNDTGYLKYWQTTNQEGAEEAVDNLAEFVAVAARYDTMQEFLDAVALGEAEKSETRRTRCSS